MVPVCVNSAYDLFLLLNFGVLAPTMGKMYMCNVVIKIVAYDKATFVKRLNKPFFE